MIHDYVRYICTVALAVCAVCGNSAWVKVHQSGWQPLVLSVVAAVSSTTIAFVSTSPSDRNLKTDLANGAVQPQQNVPIGTGGKANGV